MQTCTLNEVPVLICDLLIQSLGTCGLFKQEKQLLCTTAIATQQPVAFLGTVMTPERRFTTLQLVASGCGNIHC